MSEERETYLGDGAYAKLLAHGYLEIYTSDGIRKTNQVFLGDGEWSALVKFVEFVKRQTGAV